jgi:hypothetical protein
MERTLLENLIGQDFPPKNIGKHTEYKYNFKVLSFKINGLLCALAWKRLLLAMPWQRIPKDISG